MAAPDIERARALAAVAGLRGRAGRAALAEPAFAVLASPGWHGVDGVHWRVTDPESGECFHVKAMHADAAYYIDTQASFAAAIIASDLGIGPAVLAADVAAGVLVMEDLRGWRTGTLDRLYEPAIRGAVIAARKAFQAGPALPRTADVFAEIAHFAGMAGTHAARLPADLPWLLDTLGHAERAIAAAGADAVPAHGDGTASNIMIGPGGAVRLVDWDRAGMMDPFADLGSFLVEACAQEPEARAVFMEWHGRFDQRLFNRAMLYGTADDLRWGLIGALLAAASPRRTLEFLKYANWRFLRGRMALRDPRFIERCRSL